MIYFIQDDSILNIKIGHTAANDAGERLRALQTGSPSGLVLLYSMPGGPDLEKQLHQRFAEARVQGEWFRPVPYLIRFILDHATRATQLPAESSLKPPPLSGSLIHSLDLLDRVYSGEQSNSNSEGFDTDLAEYQHRLEVCPLTMMVAIDLFRARKSAELSPQAAVLLARFPEAQP